MGELQKRSKKAKQNKPWRLANQFFLPCPSQTSKSHYSFDSIGTLSRAGISLRSIIDTSAGGAEPQVLCREGAAGRDGLQLQASTGKVLVVGRWPRQRGGESLAAFGWACRMNSHSGPSAIGLKVESGEGMRRNSKIWE